MIGVFFGSFDPPHIGHINVVTAALNSGKVDKVIVVPAFKSVWKNTETKWDYRLAMTRVAFSKIPNTMVDGIEYILSKGEPLPTYKTIEALEVQYEEFIIITTPETYKEIPRWQNGESILSNNRFLIVSSSHFSDVDILDGGDELIYAPDITICSTNLRNRVKDGKIIIPFVTDSVSTIIQQLGLYK